MDLENSNTYKAYKKAFKVSTHINLLLLNLGINK